MPKNEARLNRVNEELKKEISHVLTFELKNSKVTGLISVTKAKITPDFKYAKIYVLHRVALLILLILPLANKGFLWYALSTERVSPMKS